MPLYEHGYNITKEPPARHRRRTRRLARFPVLAGRSTRSSSSSIASRRRRSRAPSTIRTRPTANDDLRDLTGYQLMEVVNGPFPVEDLWDAALSSGHVVWALANDDTHDVTNLRRHVHRVEHDRRASASDRRHRDGAAEGTAVRRVARRQEGRRGARRASTCSDSTLTVSSSGRARDVPVRRPGRRRARDGRPGDAGELHDSPPTTPTSAPSSARRTW